MSEAIGDIEEENMNSNNVQTDLNNSIGLEVNFDVDSIQDEYGRAVLQCADPNDFMVDLENVEIVTEEELETGPVSLEPMTVTQSDQQEV